jgi:CheY-like chemotaxis protein
VELNIRRRILETAGRQTLTVHSGEDDIQQFRSEVFHLVLMDYWMPAMKGIATARELKRINLAIRVIILSGLSQLPDETMGAVDRWIVKDEGPQFALNTIKAVLGAAS